MADGANATQGAASEGIPSWHMEILIPGCEDNDVCRELTTVVKLESGRCEGLDMWAALQLDLAVDD